MMEADITQESPHVEVQYTEIERRQADDLFTAPPKEAKWGPITASLLQGKAVFVPGMTRIQLESLRSIVNYRKYGRLRSRWTEMGGQEGRVLRIQRPGGQT